MENIEKGDLITTGKAKSLYSSSEEEFLVMHYRDDTSAFDGKKIESLEGKGTINNKFNAFIMEFLEKEGIPTHFEKILSETDWEKNCSWALKKIKNDSPCALIVKREFHD